MMNNNNVKLSICITVFNQYDIVKHHLDNVLKYDKDDVEFVISDNNSTEDIEGLVKSYNDNRIKYFRTNENLSHDLNIINALRNCSGEYAYLFRTKDYVLYDKIDYILKVLSENNDSSFFMFSCVDENMNDRIIFLKKKYISQRQKLKIHNELLIHPSGVLYKVSGLDLNLYEKHFIEHFGDSRYGLCIHSIIRIDLLQKGSFYIDSVKCWLYAHTIKSKEVSVIQTKNGVNFFHPDYDLKRLECELDFIDKYVDNALRTHLFYISLKNHFSFLFAFKRINSSIEFQNHYNFSVIDYDVDYYIKKFHNIVVSKFKIKYYRIFRYILEMYYKYIRRIIKGS